MTLSRIRNAIKRWQTQDDAKIQQAYEAARGKPHPTVPVQVWADVDEGIADLVIYLNTLPGVRTEASCQGTIGEGGPNPYPAYVMATWTPELEARLQAEFEIEFLGEHWGYIRRKAAAA